MMRRAGVVLVAAGALLAGLVAVPGAPAGAQDIADLPRLGFEIEPDRGYPGDLVEGWVDTGDIEEHCLDWVPPGQLPRAVLASYFVAEVVTPVVLGFSTVPGQPGDGPFYFGIERLQGDPFGLDIEDPVFRAFYQIYATFWVGMAASVPVQETFFAAMFPMTFVDPVTQDLLGDLGGYDPFTGEGSVEVPDLDPGLYAVAAACTFPIGPDEQVFGGGLDNALAAFSEWAAINYPDNDFPQFAGNVSDPDWQEFVEDAAPSLLQELVDIQAIGIEFYCILQPDGHCATPPGPVGLIDDDVIDEFNGDEPGIDVPGRAVDGLDDAGDLVAVQATPSFTG